jgi:predicted O-methyltransferase YrrM
VFNWVAEYPLLIVLALLCRPGALSIPQQSRERIVWAAAIIAAVAILFWMKGSSERLDDTLKNVAVVVILGTAIALWSRPLVLAAAVVFLLAANLVDNEDTSSETLRSFFGVLKISESADSNYRILMHGTTIHGAERITEPDEDDNDAEDDDKTQAEKDAKARETTRAAGERPTPLTYYFDGSPLAQTIVAAREKGGTVRLAVVGLGAGTLACQTNPADKLTYYEIDPLVVRIARDPQRFTFLSSCAPNAVIVIGDARLTLADAPDGSYDIIYVDAFSSDAIPIHLLTREAMAIYLRKLTPHGIVVVHVSNRFLELASVVTGIAAANGAVTRVNDGSDFTERESEYLFVGTVAAVARTDQDFGALAFSNYWPLQTPDLKQWVWTDDYSNVVGAVIRQLRATTTEEAP